MKVKILRNSCFLLEVDNIKFLFDPLLSKKELNKLDFDYCVISHCHVDHIWNFDKIEVPLIAPREICFKSSDIPLQSTIKFNDIELIVVPTYKHPREFQNNVLYDFIYSYCFFRKIIRCNSSFGFIIKYKETVLYYSGDTLFNKELFASIKQKYKPNLSLVNMQRYNLGCMNLLAPFKKIGEMENILESNVFPLHQTKKWYSKNFSKFIKNNQGKIKITIRKDEPK